MRSFLLISALFALPVCIAAQNDVYFVPSQKVNEVTVSDRNGAKTNYNDGYYSQYSEEKEVRPNRCNVDEYNRRRKTDDSYSSGSNTGEDKYNLQSNVNGADDNFSCTKMIVRFHSPAGIIVSSPYYWNICYDNTWDVYLDSWAFGLPSWSYWTYAYDPWYYNRWWYRTCWDYTWGWYDPWWGYSYWGWGRPAYWGWDRPYYGYWGGGWHFHNWGYGDYAPGFQHVGGGRYFASDNETVRRGSAGGWIRQGSNVYRGNISNNGPDMGSRGFTNNRGLSKSFRIYNSDNAMQTYERRAGGGFSGRSVGNGYSSRGFNRGMSRDSYNSSSNSRGNQPVYRGINRNTERTYTPQQNPPSRSYTPSNSNRDSSGSGSRGGGSIGGGSTTGGGRNGGGGFGGRR